MKKLFAFILLAVMGFVVSGCSLNLTTASPTTINETTNVSSTTTSNTPSTTTVTTSGVVTTQPVTSQTTTQTATVVTTSPPTTTVTTQPTTTAPVTTTTSPTTTADRYVDINLFSINDFHGGSYSDIYNLNYIGAYLEHQRELDPNTILVSDGDIFQGAALSNYYYGLPIVDVFNYLGFDGFVIGNHEFDWGIDKITQYRDGNLDNGEMNYPLLAANIVYTDSGDPLENTIPYIIKDVSGVKVGIIGVIGDVMNSIAASRTVNMTFLDPVQTVSDYAEELRVNQGCDVIVVYAHEGSYIDSSIANLTGSHYVDAVFNGHTHQQEASMISRSTGTSMPYAQASNSSYSLFVRIGLTYDLVLGKVVDASVRNYSYNDVSNYYDLDIVDILDSYANDSVYQTFVNQVLAHTNTSFNRSSLAPWGASVIRDYAGVDVGALNSGGFRTSMYAGDVTMGDLIVIYPFDNYIKTCDMTGQQLLYFYEKVLDRGYDVIFDDGLSYDGRDLFINGVLVEPDQIYSVGAVDYIFDKDNYGFLDGQNITTTTYLMRDLLAEDLLNTPDIFNPNLGTSYLFTPFYYDPIELDRIRQAFGF